MADIQYLKDRVILFKDGVGFLEINPELVFIPPFKGMIDDIGFKKANMVSGAIYLTEDPRSPVYQTINDEKKRREHVKNNYLKVQRFSWNKVSKYIPEYNENCLPNVLQDYAVWIKKFRNLTSWFDKAYEIKPEDDEFEVERKSRAMMKTAGDLAKMKVIIRDLEKETFDYYKGRTTIQAKGDKYISKRAKDRYGI